MMIFRFKRMYVVIIFLKFLTTLFSRAILSISLVFYAKANANEIQNLAVINGFTLEEVDVGDFVITTYQKIQHPELKEFVFYIEGDGKAFSNGFPTEDPTPLNQLLFKLATFDSRANIIYLARPCQYTDKAKNPKCNNSFYWASGRMGKEVVEATNSAINKISKTAKYNLVGYSGGGGIAILVAAMDNSNILSIVTIAGNLDVDKFKELHSIKPYFGPWVTYIDESLNPLDCTDLIRHIPQIHFSGKDDNIVPPIIAKNFVTKSNSRLVQQITIPKTDHVSGWDQVWKKFLLDNSITSVNY